MRIFKKTGIDLKSDIPFKDTLDYIDAVFDKLGITYDSMGFMFSSSGADAKVIVKYPALAKYKKWQKKGDMSSARAGDDGVYSLRVDKSEHQILRDLVKKTPRPFNFNAISVFLDNVRWFSEINTAPCLVGGPGQPSPPSAYYPFSYMSNCVTMLKHFDYGNNFNPVWFTIEVGDGNNGIIDTSILLEKLSAALDRPFVTLYGLPEYYFYYSDEEKKLLAESDKSFKNTYGPLIKELTEFVNNAEGIQHIKKQGPQRKDSLSPARVSGLSLAKAFKKALPPGQYACKGLPDGFFKVERKNENNHNFVLECDLSPRDKCLSAGMTISGCNFTYTLDINNIGKNGFEPVFPDTQDEVEYHAANLAAALIRAETELSDELLRLYGKSVC